MTDPLSDILALLEAQSVLSVGLVTGGDWSIRTSGFEGLKFNAVVRGRAWLAVDGEAEPFRLGPGDCFILTQGGPFVMASDLSLPPTEAAEAFSNASPQTGLAQFGSSDDFFVIGGKMMFDIAEARLLLDSLPPLIALPAGSEHAQTLQWLLGRLVDEFAAHRPGGASAARHLLHLMFIEGLRAHLATDNRATRGWIGALSDRRVADAIHALHAEPSRAWSLPDLAAVAGMSRSNFALRFRATVGAAPLDYLMRWRMRLARRSLRTGAATIATISHDLGYESESAFSNAFKRVVGLSPRRYRQQARGEVQGAEAA